MSRAAFTRAGFNVDQYQLAEDKAAGDKMLKELKGSGKEADKLEKGNPRCHERTPVGFSTKSDSFSLLNESKEHQTASCLTPE